jgi:hypothetical protein
MSQDDKEGPLQRIKRALHRHSVDDVDPIELERLSLTDTTDSDRVDAPAGTGFGEDELPPELRSPEAGRPDQ